VLLAQHGEQLFSVAVGQAQVQQHEIDRRTAGACAQAREQREAFAEAGGGEDVVAFGRHRVLEGAAQLAIVLDQIGRASCRERV